MMILKLLIAFGDRSDVLPGADRCLESSGNEEWIYYYKQFAPGKSGPKDPVTGVRGAFVEADVRPILSPNPLKMCCLALYAVLDLHYEIHRDGWNQALIDRLAQKIRALQCLHVTIYQNMVALCRLDASADKYEVCLSFLFLFLSCMFDLMNYKHHHYYRTTQAGANGQASLAKPSSRSRKYVRVVLPKRLPGSRNNSHATCAPSSSALTHPFCSTHTPHPCLSHRHPPQIFVTGLWPLTSHRKVEQHDELNGALLDLLLNQWDNFAGEMRSSVKATKARCGAADVAPTARDYETDFYKNRSRSDIPARHFASHEVSFKRLHNCGAVYLNGAFHDESDYAAVMHPLAVQGFGERLEQSIGDDVNFPQFAYQRVL